MSTACPIDGTTSGTVNGSSASIPIFPGEQPSYKDLRQWIERTETALSQTTFGPALRGVTPPHLIHLTIKRDSGIVELSADDKAKAGVLEIARYERDIAKARAEETIRIKQLEIGELEYKNKLAALFQASLRPNAGLRLRKLLKLSAIQGTNTHDGILMWRELIKLLDDPSSMAERREHDRVIEAARDTPLPDGCTVQEFCDKVTVLSRDHLPYATHAYKGDVLGHFIIGLMPEANNSDKLIITTSLSDSGTLGDYETVMSRCSAVVRAHAKAKPTPIAQALVADKKAAMSQLTAALASAGVDAAVIANFTASLAKGKGGRANGGSKKPAGKDGDKPNKFKLPDGQTCSSGSCNYAHDKFSPGSPCFRSWKFKGPLPKSYRDNARQVAKLEEARKADAARNGATWTPLLPCTPPTTAAAIPIAEDAMGDAVVGDYFTLSPAMMPLLPVNSAGSAAVCLPCDESQWCFSDDSDWEQCSDAESFAQPSSDDDSDDDEARLYAYSTPVRSVRGDSALMEAVSRLGDDSDDDAFFDREPPPPPSKAASMSRPSALRAAAAALGEPELQLQVSPSYDKLTTDFSSPGPDTTFLPRMRIPRPVLAISSLAQDAAEVADLPSGDSTGPAADSMAEGAVEGRPGCAATAARARCSPDRGRACMALSALVMLGVVCATVSFTVAVGMPATALALPVTALSCVTRGASIASTMGPTFAGATVLRPASALEPLPLDALMVRLVLGLGLLAIVAFLLVSRSMTHAARTAGRAVGRTGDSICACLRAVAARGLFVLLMLMAGPQRGESVISTASASRVSSLVSVISRTGSHDVAHAAACYVRNNLNLAVVPEADADACLRLGAALRLRQEPVPVMSALANMGDSSALVRPRGLHLADSGAGIHAVNDMRYVVPGSLRPNSTAVATANGITVPPHRCDAVLAVREVSGSVHRLELRDAVLLTDCQHSLVSLGLLARDELASTTISAGTSESFIKLADGTKLCLVNSGVMLLPDASVPMSAIRACQRGGGSSSRPRRPAGTVTYETLHNRFNGRAYKSLRHLVTTVKDVPRSWVRALAKSPSDFCEACLRARADKLHSSAHVPKVDRPGSISYDIYEAGVPHIHGGHKYIIGFHDAYSGVNMVYNLMSKSHAHLAMDKYHAWARSHGVDIFRFHADNAGELTGEHLKEKWAARGVRITACAPHEPRGNGMMERQWRTLGNDTRHALSLSGMPAGYYYYFLKAAVQASWSIPLNSQETPWQRFTGKPAPARYLRVPGCLAYYKVVHPPSKMSMRARRAIHLGRAWDQPAYILLDIETRSIVTTPHVRFVEDIFPGLSSGSGRDEHSQDEIDSLFRLPLLHDGCGDALEPSAPTDEPPPSPSSRGEGVGAPAAPAPHTCGPDDVSALDERLAAVDGSDSDSDSPRAGVAGAAHNEGRISSRLTRPSHYRSAPLSVAAPATGAFWLYIGSGPRREGDMASHMSSLGGAPVVNIDTRVGGYDHDLTHSPVRVAILELAQSPRCLGAFISLPCKTFSVLRGKPGVEFSKPLRSLEHVTGIPREDGSLPPKVVASNMMSELAAQVMMTIHSKGGVFVAESPPSRAAGSRFPIEGREEHASQFDYPSWVAVQESTGARFVYFDQCPMYDDPTQTSVKKTAFMVSSNAYTAFHRRFAPMVCDHPSGTHKTMYGLDSEGKFLSPSTENYPPRMNALIAEALHESSRSRSAVAAAAALDPMADWCCFYDATADLDWAGTHAADADVSPFEFLKAAAPILGRDLEPQVYESAIDGQLFAATRKSDDDCPSFRKARASPDWPKWHEACENEINNLRRNGTIDENQAVPEDTLPTWVASKGRATQVVNILWVLRIKYVDGVVDKFKARAVFDGRSQKANDPTLETFSPACRSTTFKLAVAEACRNGLRLRTWDVEAAYLKGKFPDGAEVLYARPPPGYRRYVNGVPMIWRLKTPLYGEADAGRIWYKTFMRFMLEERGFTQSLYDPCLLWKILPNGSRMTCVIYVDDGISSDDGSPDADVELEAIHVRFKIVVKLAAFFLGNNIECHSNHCVTLSSRAYVQRMTARYLGAPEKRPAAPTPCDRRIVEHYEEAVQRRRDSAAAASAELQKAYPSKVGALIFCVPASRLDCAYAIGVLARCLTFPTAAMDSAADRCLAYLHQHDSVGITYDSSCARPELHAYSDSDWSTSHSTSGWAILYCGAAVGYGSKRQQSIALSSTEAEIMAASQAAAEIMYFRGILHELGRVLEEPTVLYVDNRGAIELSKDMKSCKRSRHIERRYLKIRELVAEGEIVVKYVASAENHADMLTKPLDTDTFECHLSALSGSGSIRHRGGC